jgi:formylglycine-generating enzyme required for sulfatase activity
MTRRTRLVGAILAATLALTFPARASAPPGRYTVSGGTVLDTKTKLTWQQQTPTTLYTWADAKTYCAGLGGTLGGSGWRLPTIRELVTLIDYSQGTPPVIDTTTFPGTPVADFWSSSPQAGSSTNVWEVWFYFGNPRVSATTSTLNVLCVR